MRSVSWSPAPNATVAFGLRRSMRVTTRLKWRCEIMCGHSSRAEMSSP